MKRHASKSLLLKLCKADDEEMGRIVQKPSSNLPILRYASYLHHYLVWAKALFHNSGADACLEGFCNKDNDQAERSQPEPSMAGFAAGPWQGRVSGAMERPRSPQLRQRRSKGVML